MECVEISWGEPCIGIQQISMYLFCPNPNCNPEHLVLQFGTATTLQKLCDCAGKFKLYSSISVYNIG
jgi:hypothetical protein